MPNHSILGFGDEEITLMIFLHLPPRQIQGIILILEKIFLSDYSFEVGDHFGDFINDNYGYASQSDEDSNDFGADGDGFDTSDEIGTES